jgi:hypothetical protein
VEGEPVRAFVADPDPKVLHQGDLFRATMFPRWDINTYRVSGGHRQQQLDGTEVDVLAFEDLEADRMDISLRHPQPVRFMLCSHSCELDKPTGRLGFLLAPVLPPNEMTPDRREKFRQSFRPTGDGNIEYVDQFPVELDDGLWAVHFSAMMSVGSPKKVIPWLLERKERQLTDEFRRYLGAKLALFFGRPDEPSQHDPEPLDRQAVPGPSSHSKKESATRRTSSRE